MKTIVLIGHTGTGKSEIVKNLIRGNCFVNDIQNEYGSRTKYPNQTPVNLTTDVTKPRSRYVFGNPKMFIKIALKKRNTVVVFEDATGFLEGRLSDDLRTLITNKMFTKNTYVFVFHSILSVPPKVIQMSDIVILFHTNDEYEHVKRKYGSLYPKFVEGKESKKYPLVINLT
jgi:hypothetical protein